MKNFKIILFLLFILPFFMLSAASAAYDKKDEAKEERPTYREFNIKGWKVRVHEKLLKMKIARKRAEKSLKKQLTTIKFRVPKAALANLRKVPIWLFYDAGLPKGAPDNVVAYYSPDDKAVVFHKARILEDLGETKNAVVLHELAHGYHDIVLGYDDKEIIDAYEKAKKRGKYKNVKNINGSNVEEAYALTNHAEYFAELSEAYFSRNAGQFSNDYYPFVRSELRRYDAKGYRVVRDAWKRR